MKFVLFSFVLLICILPSSTYSSLVLGNETDYLALLSFKAEQASNDPFHIMASWNESTHFCNWVGVTCSPRHQRVIAMSLQPKELSGPLSPAIGNLCFLRDLCLQENAFTGIIPQEIGRLSRLRTLGLANNLLSGEIPANISKCLNLEILDLGGNKLVGTIPLDSQYLLKLQILNLYSNNLTGEIPAFLGNFSNLQTLSGLGNNFRGSIPDTLGQLTKLVFLGFTTNNLSGTIPPSIFNLSSLVIIDLADNQIGGGFPSYLGLSLPRLQIFNVALNRMTGLIPVSISNASQLVRLAVNGNSFTGRVPHFDGLQLLETLALNFNQLGFADADDLSFFPSLINCTKLRELTMNDNNLGGAFPKSIGNFSKLTKLTMGINQITGNIPVEIGELVNLELLLLGQNHYTGGIPDFIGKLQTLKVLSLYGSNLSGYIPSSLGNLTLLIRLYLDVNSLQGSIPASIAKCKNLLLMGLSQNNLSGHIPKEVFGVSSLSLYLDLSYNNFVGSLLLETGDLQNLVQFDVSRNNLSGEISDGLGSCTSLSFLSVAGNMFQGQIPQSFSSLKALEVLDVSGNNLTGNIPAFLGSFLFLQNLNLSFNDFEGEVPIVGVFNNKTAVSLEGNSMLCGGILELQLPKCAIRKESKKNGISLALILVIAIVSGILVVLLILLFVFIYKRRHTKKVHLSEFPTRDVVLKVSYGSLYRVTDGFSPANLIGSGNFSSVYRGILDETDTVVAVKVLNLQVHGANKSFMAECEVLRSIRHRNIMKILTACSSIDHQGKDFKALVYAYMVSGSLEGWLHQKEPIVGVENEEPKSLTLLQRLDIAIDVACALDYLHHQCGTTVVHCDLKPSNILLDIDLVAHVGDFGLARILPGAFPSSQSSSVAIKGTIGYAAPEYGMGCEVSTYGDVYSYGILVLELFTGKRPTDDMFNNGLNLHSFARMALDDRVMEISDPVLRQSEAEEETGAMIGEFLTSIYRIGVACSMEVPRERMDIRAAFTELQLIRDNFLGTYYVCKIFGGKTSKQQNMENLLKKLSQWELNTKSFPSQVVAKSKMERIFQ
ncbi:hypothetical protein RJ640_000780 [Escallonia rubra]|uniref:non-specific serine/threonine protein kinase n=1 Tax=Escallonia rubra TaxID=112253 RepID=A0AA88RTR0_9ASTE|nr:hypothetical protein RJ640_000780 [Escallonia rubra]